MLVIIVCGYYSLGVIILCLGYKSILGLGLESLCLEEKVGYNSLRGGGGGYNYFCNDPTFHD